MVWTYLGIEYAEQEEFKEAINCYKKAIQLDADDDYIWDNLRYAYYRIEEYEKAEHCRKRAVELKKDEYRQYYKQQSRKERLKSYYI